MHMLWLNKTGDKDHGWKSTEFKSFEKKQVPDCCRERKKIPPESRLPGTDYAIKRPV